MTHCRMCGGEIPDLDEGATVCMHCGAVAVAVVMIEPERPLMLLGDGEEDLVE